MTTTASPIRVSAYTARSSSPAAAPARFPLLPLLNRAIAAQRLRGELHRGDWCDVGTPERLASLDARVRAVQ